MINEGGADPDACARDQSLKTLWAADLKTEEWGDGAC